MIEQSEAIIVTRPSGDEYQIVLNIRWDRKPGGLIRIIGSIDDAGISAFIPLTSSRLVKSPILG